MGFRTAVAAAVFLAVFVPQHAPAGAQGGRAGPGGRRGRAEGPVRRAEVVQGVRSVRGRLRLPPEPRT